MRTLQRASPSVFKFLQPETASALGWSDGTVTPMRPTGPVYIAEATQQCDFGDSKVLKSPGRQLRQPRENQPEIDYNPGERGKQGLDSCPAAE